MQLDQGNFSWDRVRDLFGVPYRDARVQELFTRVGLNPDALWQEVRVGIYSMPPHDARPSPVAEIDLSPSFRVRLRFRHSILVLGAEAVPTTTFVFAGITYFLENAPESGRENAEEKPQPVEPFTAGLPYGIRPTDTEAGVVERVGRPPTGRQFPEGGEVGFLIWEDRNPVLHVLFNVVEKRAQRVNVFLASRPD